MNSTKESLLKKKRNPEDWKWCSYCQTLHKKSAFYCNSSHGDGLSNECKVTNKMRSSGRDFLTIFESLPYKEKQLYAM